MTKALFVSGLPRSGSTLLASILRQNPEFCADMTSPVLSLLGALQARMSGSSEFATSIDDSVHIRVLRSLFSSFYGERWRGVVFDTNRLWCARTSLLSELFPEFKIIALVRPLDEILESFEFQLSKNPSMLSRTFNFSPDLTIYERAEILLSGQSGIVGRALSALKEAYYGPFSDRLLILSYCRLVEDTEAAIEKIYEFIGEPRHQHDFLSVGFERPEFDIAVGMPGLHTVRAAVSREERPKVLPPDITERFARNPFWVDEDRKSLATRFV